MSQEERESDPASPDDSASVNATFCRGALQGQRKSGGGLVLILSLAAFVLVFAQDMSVEELLILVGVLFLHEAGHLIGMRAFGFSDLSMFFLPFFGAAAAGRKPGASAVEHAMVSLAGPLPGLLLALPLLSFAGLGSLGDEPLSMPTMAVFMLVIINVLNLMPILPLDGGRLFEAILFGRWPVLDVAFRVVAILALGWVAMNELPLIGVVAAILALGLPHQCRIAFESARLRRARALTSSATMLNDEELELLYAASDRATPGNAGAATREKLLATTIVQIYDRATRRPATWWQSILLVGLWVVGVLVGLGEILYLAYPE